jgi:hypothetical protein
MDNLQPTFSTQVSVPTQAAGLAAAARPTPTTQSAVQTEQKAAGATAAKAPLASPPKTSAAFEEGAEKLNAQAKSAGRCVIAAKLSKFIGLFTGVGYLVGMALKRKSISNCCDKMVKMENLIKKSGSDNLKRLLSQRRPVTGETKTGQIITTEGYGRLRLDNTLTESERNFVENYNSLYLRLDDSLGPDDITMTRISSWEMMERARVRIGKEKTE